jgi:hypothetical protein
MKLFVLKLGTFQMQITFFFAAELTSLAVTFVSLHLLSYLGGHTLVCPKSRSLFLCTLTNLDNTANKRNGAN